MRRRGLSEHLRPRPVVTGALGSPAEGFAGRGQRDAGQGQRGRQGWGEPQRAGAAQPGDDTVEQAVRPVRRWPAVAMLALLAVVLAGVTADGELRRRETGRLLAQVEAGQSSLGYAQRRIAGTVTYASPQLTSGPPSVRADLRRLVQDEVAGQVPALDQAAAQVREVQMLPWHGAQRDARAAYGRYLALQAARFELASGDLDRLYDAAPELERVRRAAADALREASSAGQADRVDALLGLRRG